MRPFARGHGLGNDYIVLDGEGLGLTLTEARLQLLCDRHQGLGGDGVLLCTGRGPAAVRIFNPDGSEAEKSGNGLRIFARWLHSRGEAPAGPFTIDLPTLGDRVTAKVEEVEGGPVRVEVDMGRASFRPADLPATLPGPEAVEVPLVLRAGRLTVTLVSVGNPHCVIFVDDPAGFPLDVVGPEIERHPAFPRRTNVQVARMEGGADALVRIWERGAGITAASGSSACAVAAAAVRTGRASGRRVAVHMPGGILDVEVGDGFALRQRGPAEIIATGIIGPDLWRRLLALGAG